VRSALLDGARWWNQAFEAAGYRGAFRVEILPDSADPMDVRYNVVQWENRNERGWSIGGSLGDPRTGEIRKGMARMDSHRARTDYNLYAALMGADAAAADTAFVLARVRQVSAHEVGHTLGLQHNYIASTYGRASVMDYPAPRARLGADGDIDLSSAYGTGPGDYDVWAIRYGYGVFPAGTERDSLAAIVAEGLRKGYLYLSDGDARPESASDPRTNLWDDASTPNEFLRHQTEVRRVALSRFGLRNIRVGEPVATLEERLAPLYFWHRLALNGVTKTIGGMEYASAVRGDGQTATRPIDGRRQREALTLLLAALQPAELAIPDTVLSLIGPRPSGYDAATNNTNSPVGELFRGRTDPAFDELSAARTLAQMIVDGILQRERAARLVAFATRGPDMLTLGETVDSLVARTWNARDAGASPKLVALRRVTQRAVADRLLAMAADTDAAPEVRAMAEYQIGRLRAVAQQRSVAGDTMSRAHWASLAGDFARWVERRELPRPSPPLVAPPGDPFGEP
ncbi:MAG TPA: zinc-dependent metalloprotease, partial [Gemmatimonadaceae bacterium]|nr:zinc-dependent metalloprotease [Gemmatimonadaceae bacterium]